MEQQRTEQWKTEQYVEDEAVEDGAVEDGAQDGAEQDEAVEDGEVENVLIKMFRFINSYKYWSNPIVWLKVCVPSYRVRGLETDRFAGERRRSGERNQGRTQTNRNLFNLNSSVVIYVSRVNCIFCLQATDLLLFGFSRGFDFDSRQTLSMRDKERKQDYRFSSFLASG